MKGIVFKVELDENSAKNLFSILADTLGVESNPLSEKCQLILERDLPKEVCQSFRDIRRWVLCKAWQHIDEGKMSFREAIKKAWSEAKLTCAKHGVVV